jgi:hypothetical protein
MFFVQILGQRYDTLTLTAIPNFSLFNVIFDDSNARGFFGFPLVA